MKALAVATAFVLLAIAFTTSPDLAGGNAPDRAGPVVRVMVGTVAHGSGVHIGSGLILTAAHVADNSLNAPKDEPRPLAIRDDRGSEVAAEVLWSSESDDVALLKVESPALEASEIVCRPLAIGEPVMTYGNPSMLHFARSWGRVSTAPQPIGEFRRAVGIDAAVMTGLSGGPLYDDAGMVVGIVVGTLTNDKSSGFNIAVPAPVICELLAR